jgi:glycerol transport system permease protein
LKTHDNRAWLLVMPALAILVVVGFIPLLTVFNYSFLDIFTLDQRFWVGLDWYHQILSSPRFIASFGRSLLFSAIVLAIQIPLGILIALSIPRDGVLRTAMLILVALPLLVPWNMIPAMWLSLINLDTGMVGGTMKSLGIAFDYKFNPVHTWIVIVAMDVWHWTGLVAILCYSALATIPHPHYQAAAIDGASRLQVFRYVQLPKMSGVLLMALLLRFMDSFMIYTEAFRINAGGPRNATTFLSLDLGENINAFNYGPAAARSVIYFVIVLIIAWAFKTIMDARNRSETARPA